MGKDCRLKPEELASKCLESPACRKSFVEKVKEDVEDVLNATLVEAIKRANERPPIWWQWLMLIGVGILGGVGLGLAIAQLTGLGAPSVELPPPPAG